ncbi:olfactory receptor 10A7-like [Tachyglossus aculeatus]|uniref:olfactory receptor 10A7-like n=1 Tax=Tachyglossus aculeatus TaxID=9261 RepID=UPI0018F663FC|nr:olfactory receptor 10A7-like [Tachyglossus aculeatus]
MLHLECQWYRNVLKVIQFMIFLVTYLIAMIGNSLLVSVSTVDSALQTPMHFFLGSLSLVNIGCTTVIIPKMFTNFLSKNKSISYGGCAALLYFSFFFGPSECWILTTMAYDRQATICDPLHYTLIMNRRHCLQLALAFWISGIPVATVQTVVMFIMPFYGPNVINHFFCDSPPLLDLVCMETFVIETDFGGKAFENSKFLQAQANTFLDEFQVILFMIFVVIYLIAMIGNTLLVLVSTLDPALQTPMYIFLRNMSLMDIGYTTVIIPKMLTNFLSKDKSISFEGCASQMYFSFFFGSSECWILTMMAYDRQAAISDLLHYSLIMNWRFCLQLALASWLAGIPVATVQTAVIFTLFF